MSIYDEIINDNLKLSRMMVRQLNHVKKEDCLEDLQTLVFAGLLTYYGQERLDDIYLAFLKCHFIPVSGDFDKFLRENYEFNSATIGNIKRHCMGTFYDVEAREFVNKETRKRRYEFDRKIYVEDDGKIDCDDLIRSVVHQVNHVVNSIHNPVVATIGSNGYGLSSRMGLSYERFNGRTSEGYALEESINKLQTDEIFDEILGYSFFELVDENAKKMVDDAMSSSSKKEKVVHDELTELIRPLYENRSFNDVLVNNRVSGLLKAIEREFDSKTSVGAYSEFRGLCDKVASPIISPVVNKPNVDKVKVYVKEYSLGSINGGKKDGEVFE